MSIGSIALITSLLFAGLLWVIGRRDATKSLSESARTRAKQTSSILASTKIFTSKKRKGNGLELEELGIEELEEIAPNWQHILKRMLAAHKYLEEVASQDVLPKLATEIITTSALLAIDAQPLQAELAEHDLKALMNKPSSTERSLITHLLALEERLELLHTVLEEAACTLEGKQGAHPDTASTRLPKEAELETLAHRLRLLL